MIQNVYLPGIGHKVDPWIYMMFYTLEFEFEKRNVKCWIFMMTLIAANR